jgi:hypothetical protein
LPTPEKQHSKHPTPQTAVTVTGLDGTRYNTGTSITWQRSMKIRLLKLEGATRLFLPCSLLCATSLPSQHPVRVIAKIMDDAPSRSVVRVYAYMLTDMDAIDLLAHDAKHKTVNVIVIVHPNTQSFNRMTQFFNEFGNNARRHFANVRERP